MIVDCQYKIVRGELPKLEGCAVNFNEEQQDAISRAFNKINVTIDIDDTWGFCKIIAVNGHKVEE